MGDTRLDDTHNKSGKEIKRSIMSGVARGRRSERKKGKVGEKKDKQQRVKLEKGDKQEQNNK